MALPIQTSLPPMEATSVDEIPTGGGWQYEPKWDGFRCLVFRDGDHLELQSKSGQPLGRYFPELVEAFLSLPSRRFVLDGEIVIPIDGRLSFDQLLQRIHPAESRVRKLSQQHPANFMAFDLLVDPRGKSLLPMELAERRKRLEAFADRNFPDEDAGPIRLSPATTDVKTARRWFRSAGKDLDGVIAKQLDRPYAAGERDAVLKIKPMRTADCVVGGFRYATRGKLVGSLLLGLYNDEGLLDHVGFSSSFTADERKKLTPQVESLRGSQGFTGRAPGGPSRWSTARSTEWQPLRPEMVVEVEYDHFTGGRFRHGTKLLRQRPDKAPRQCLMEQVVPKGRGLGIF
jgi:ATP-dependent DNA ligase